MALNIEQNFNPAFQGWSTSQPSDIVGEICTVRCEAGEIAVAGAKKKRRWLDIDLNAPPPDDSPAADCGSNCRWEALLDVAEVAGIEHEKNFGGTSQSQSQSQSQSRSQSPSRRGESTRATRRGGRMGDGCDVETVVPPRYEVKSKRGRTLALPTKYKDSFLGELSELLGSESAAAVAPAKRRFR